MYVAMIESFVTSIASVHFKKYVLFTVPVIIHRGKYPNGSQVLLYRARSALYTVPVPSKVLHAVCVTFKHTVREFWHSVISL